MWASRYIAELKEGREVRFRPHGNSMAGRVENGSLVTVAPVGNKILTEGMVVLCKVRGAQYLHKIVALKNNQVLIGNNRGRINGWTSYSNVFGILRE